MVITSRMRAVRRAGLSLALVPLALAGCRTTPEAPPAPAPRAEAPTPAPPAAPTLELATVYFDFDSAMLRSDAQATLKKNAEVIRAASGDKQMIKLAGYCDERGSEEYNLAL